MGFYQCNRVCSIYLTTIPVEPGFLWHFVHLSLKTCSPYHEKQYIQKFKVISSQFPNNFFSASDIMEAVRGRFCFYRYESKVAWYKLDCCKVSLDNKHNATDYPRGREHIPPVLANHSLEEKVEGLWFLVLIYFIKMYEKLLFLKKKWLFKVKSWTRTGPRFFVLFCV